MNVADIWQRDPNFRKKESPGYVTDDMMLNCNLELFKKENPERGLRNNCVKCSNTLELMKRGYDVQAGRSAYGMLNTASQYYWDGAIAYKEKGVDNIMTRLNKMGHKASGEFNMRRPDGSGHSVYFQTIKTDSGYETQFIDGQTRKKYAGSDALSQLIAQEGFDTTKFANITRLDNATPNFSHMAEDSVARVNYTNKDMNAVASKQGDYWTNVKWTG